jgi:predicted nucleic acid-binding protein
MGANALIDTGAILALLDSTDRWHRVCMESFKQLRLPLLTSEGVLTELFHLLGDNRSEMESAWKFLPRARSSSQRSSIRNCRKSPH